MHKLYDYACEELKELEKKAGDKGLSAAELEYADKLTELKKNILKIGMLEDAGYSADEMGYAGDHDRSYRDGRYQTDGRSYARGRGPYAKRDAMGRYAGDAYRYSRGDGYSMDAEDLIDQLEEMKGSAPDDHSRRELAKLIEKMRNA